MTLPAPQLTSRDFVVRVCLALGLWLLALSGAAYAQTFTLSGGVYGGGSPLGSTTVEALTNGTTTAVAQSTTTSAGQYSLAVPAGVYDLRVTPPAGSGFAQEIVQDVEVTANRQFDVILLSGSSTISGTVRGVGGQPVAGASVVVRLVSNFQVVSSATTDAQG